MSSQRHRVLISLGNSGLCWTVFAWNRDTAVPAKGNGDLQTLICVLVARPRRCLILSNPVPWQNWMAAYLSYTLRMKTMFRGWPVMFHDTHTRRRSATVYLLWKFHHHRRRRGPLHRSNSTTMVDGTPPEFHWWTGPVKSGLSIKCGVYQGIVSSRDQQDDEPTNRRVCGPWCAQEHHSQAKQSVQNPRCDGPPGFRPMAWDLCVPASTSFLACNSRLRSAIRWHHSPQRAVLSQICCFGERKLVLFQILLDNAEPHNAGMT